MLNGVLPPLLRLSSRCEPCSEFPKCSLLIDWHFSSEIKQVREEINMSVATSTGELILYFKQILKTWAGKLSRNSAGRAHFTGLRRSSKLKRAHLKLFSLGGTFSVELSLATYRVRFGKWLVKRSNTTLAPKVIEKIKILGDVLELPAKQKCQISPFGPFLR